MLNEHQVIDLVDKLTKILNKLSLLDPSIHVTLTYSLSCMSKSLSDPGILNAPEVTFNDLLKELSKPEYSKVLGIMLVMLRNAANCIEGDIHVKGSGA